MLYDELLQYFSVSLKRWRAILIAVITGITIGMTHNIATAQTVSQYKLPYPVGQTCSLTRGMYGTGNNYHPNDGWNTNAYDFASCTNTTVVAARAGRVISLYKGSGTNLDCNQAMPSNWYQYTNYVLIDHGDGQSSIYAHLEKDSVSVNVGDYIRQGKIIGRMSNTGYACGIHLHYAVQKTPPSSNYGNTSGGYWQNTIYSTFSDRDVVNRYSNGVPLSSSTYKSDNADTSGKIFQMVGGNWKNLPGLATNIDVGANGSVWITGTIPTLGGYGIYNWNTSTSNWNQIDGAAVQVAVDPNGSPWVVNDVGVIYKRVNNSWQQMPGLARDIDIGANGSVWIIGTDKIPNTNDYGIYNWNTSTSSWQKIDGGAVRIAVDPKGNPWVVNANGDIYQRVGNSWDKKSGLARDIDIGANGSVWIIGTDETLGGYGIYSWNASTSSWNKSIGAAVQVAVDPTGTPWVVNSGI